jgi:hypothetical protein
MSKWLRWSIVMFVCIAFAGLAGDKVFATSVHGAHGTQFGEFQLRVVSDPPVIEANAQVNLTLTLLDPHGAVVRELEVIHEKLVHLIVVRDGLDVFTHLHPDLVEGVFSKTVAFPAAGTYYLYADFKPLGGQPVTAMAEVRVQGDAVAAPALEVHVPGRIMTEALGADITLEQVSGAYRISFAVLAPDATPVADLEPYLGAMGHLVIISANGKEYVHAHPMDGGPAGPVVFEAHFPGPGLYKAWGEFQRGGQVHNVPFALEVK